MSDSRGGSLRLVGDADKPPTEDQILSRAMRDPVLMGAINKLGSHFYNNGYVDAEKKVASKVQSSVVQVRGIDPGVAYGRETTAFVEGAGIVAGFLLFIHLLKTSN